VDEGIYVWSLAAQQEYAAYYRNRRILSLLYYLFFGGSGLFFLLWMWGKLRESYGWGERLSTLGMYGVGGGFLSLILSFTLAMFISPLTGGAFMTTCYEWGWLHRPDIRSPKLTKDYIGLVDKYRGRGIISDKTYNKIIRMLKEDKPI
jgi:hypothetical protein